MGIYFNAIKKNSRPRPTVKIINDYFILKSDYVELISYVK
jgi:hypothetical protein